MEEISMGPKLTKVGLWWLCKVSPWPGWTTFLRISFIVCFQLGWTTRETLVGNLERVKWSNSSLFCRLHTLSAGSPWGGTVAKAGTAPSSGSSFSFSFIWRNTRCLHSCREIHYWLLICTHISVCACVCVCACACVHASVCVCLSPWQKAEASARARSEARTDVGFLGQLVFSPLYILTAFPEDFKFQCQMQWQQP